MHVLNGTAKPSEIDFNVVPAIRVDESSWKAESWEAEGLPIHAVKMHGLFIPPNSGEYRMCVKATGRADVYLSHDDEPTNKVR